MIVPSIALLAGFSAVMAAPALVKRQEASASLISAAATATGSVAPSSSATPDQGNGEFAGWTGPNGPRTFTSIAKIEATPDTIINNNQTAVAGQEGASLTFTLGMNSAEDYICYKIVGMLTGNYSSPAVTATHMHAAAAGRAGPPRLAFLNPTNATNTNAQPGNGNGTLSAQGTFERRSSYGCLDGPFTTGVLANGTDTGSNFTIAQIEANPAGFFVDTHSGAFPAGAVRGQITPELVTLVQSGSASSAAAAPTRI